VHVINKFILFIFLIGSSVSTSFSKEAIFVAEDLPPFHFLDENNQPTGVLVDVVKAIAQEANIDITIELMPFARCYQSTMNQADVFMFSLLKTPDRTPEFKWVGQTYKAKAYLVGLKDRTDIQLNHIDDAKDLVVGTIRGYHSEHYLKEAHFSTDKNLNLSVNYEQMWGMLFKKRIDLILTNFIALELEVESIGLNPDSIVPYLELDDFPNQLHIATSLTTSDQKVNLLKNALNSIKADGRYQKILAKWTL